MERIMNFILRLVYTVFNLKMLNWINRKNGVVYSRWIANEHFLQRYN